MLSMPRIVRPDPHRFRGTEFGFPAGRATRRSIKRNKELAKPSDREMRQSSEPLVACAFPISFLVGTPSCRDGAFAEVEAKNRKGGFS